MLDDDEATDVVGIIGTKDDESVVVVVVLVTHEP